MMNTSPTDPVLSADVIVLGGGPAGATVALNLAPFCRVLLLDKVDDAQDSGNGPSSLRVGESLPAAAGRLLRDMGLYDEFVFEGHQPCRVTRSHWGSPQAQEQDELRNLDGHGWHLDRKRFDAWMRSVAVRRGARLLKPAKALSMRPLGTGEGAGWALRFQHDGVVQEAHAPWLVDASGRQSFLDGRMDTGRRVMDKLVCGWVRGVDKPDRDTEPHAALADAEIHAEPSGWWYTAALPDHQRVVCFFTDADLPSASAAHRTANLLARLSMVPPLKLNLILAGFKPDLRTAGFCAAHTVWRSRVQGPGWVAVGDAALAFDPLSSQGLFHALYTGLAASESIHAQIARQDVTSLPSYQRTIEAVDRAFQRHQREWYAQEGRWPNEVFWQRRGAGAVLGSLGTRLQAPLRSIDTSASTKVWRSVG